MNNKKRVPYIDCIRVFACFLVVAVHCNFMPTRTSDHIWSQILGVIGSPSSELFLTISGALLIPVKTSTKYFFKRRFSKLLPPFLIWSLVGILFLIMTEQQEPNRVWFLLLSIPIKSNIIPVFWFMYSIMALYLLAPVISPFIVQKGKTGGKMLLILWILTLLLPLLNIINPEFYYDDNNPKAMLSVFSGYAGYMILGWFLKTYPFKFTKMKYGWLIPLSGLAIIVMIVVTVGVYAPKYRDYVCGDLSFVNMLYVVSLFTLIQSLFQKENYITRIAEKMTKYTFGVYMIHVFVIYFVYLIFEKEAYPVMFQLPITAITSFLLSVVIVWTLTNIKPFRWMVQGISLDNNSTNMFNKNEILDSSIVV